MKYCKYCKMEYKLYELHITTNKHFIKKITTKKVRFADVDIIRIYELSNTEKQDKIDNYNLIKKMIKYNRKKRRNERKSRKRKRKRKREEFLNF